MALKKGDVVTVVIKSSKVMPQKRLPPGPSVIALS